MVFEVKPWGIDENITTWLKEAFRKYKHYCHKTCICWESTYYQSRSEYWCFSTAVKTSCSTESSCFCRSSSIEISCLDNFVFTAENYCIWYTVQFHGFLSADLHTKIEGCMLDIFFRIITSRPLWKCVAEIVSLIRGDHWVSVWFSRCHGFLSHYRFSTQSIFLVCKLVIKWSKCTFRFFFAKSFQCFMRKIFCCMVQCSRTCNLSPPQKRVDYK